MSSRLMKVLARNCTWPEQGSTVPGICWCWRALKSLSSASQNLDLSHDPMQTGMLFHISLPECLAFILGLGDRGQSRALKVNGGFWKGKQEWKWA